MEMTDYEREVEKYRRWHRMGTESMLLDSEVKAHEMTESHEEKKAEIKELRKELAELKTQDGDLRVGIDELHRQWLVRYTARLLDKAEQSSCELAKSLEEVKAEIDELIDIVTTTTVSTVSTTTTTMTMT